MVVSKATQSVIINRPPVLSLTIQSGCYNLFTKEYKSNLASVMSSNFSQSIPQGKIVLTYDEYCLLPNDRNRYEILDGELSVTPAPATRHQTVLGNLHRILANHVV